MSFWLLKKAMLPDFFGIQRGVVFAHCTDSRFVTVAVNKNIRNIDLLHMI